VNDDIETPAYPKYSPEHAYALEAEVEKLRGQLQDVRALAQRRKVENETLRELEAFDADRFAQLKRAEAEVEKLQEQVNGNLSTTRRKDAIIKELRAEVGKLNVERLRERPRSDTGGGW